MKRLFLAVGIASLAFGLYSSLAFFWGQIDQATYRNWLLIATGVWFVFATLSSGGEHSE